MSKYTVQSIYKGSSKEIPESRNISIPRAPDDDDDDDDDSIDEDDDGQTHRNCSSHCEIIISE